MRNFLYAASKFVRFWWPAILLVIFIGTLNIYLDEIFKFMIGGF